MLTINREGKLLLKNDITDGKSSQFKKNDFTFQVIDFERFSQNFKSIYLSDCFSAYHL